MATPVSFWQQYIHPVHMYAQPQPKPTLWLLRVSSPNPFYIQNAHRLLLQPLVSFFCFQYKSSVEAARRVACKACVYINT